MLDSDTLWQAFGLVLVFEGLLPFASPGGWKRMFSQILQLSDGQIRFFGMVSITLGMLLLWWLAP